MADFIAELTPNDKGEVSLNPNFAIEEPSEMPHPTPMWDLHVDEASNGNGCGAGLILCLPELEHLKIEYALQLGFKASNNKAKYEALSARLRLA